MIVIVKEPGKAAEIREIEDSLEACQKIVGGYIEVIALINGFDLVCNEEFLFHDFEPNVIVDNQPIHGTVFVTKPNDEGKFVSLTDSEARTAIMIMNRQAIALA